ncbi:MAG: hypothetical protein KAR20_06190 [Candidatus Heimdallarchaeota archaeon]|nr:hypothetical protein [Candidatus Heimdallarchaeota archaeon]
MEYKNTIIGIDPGATGGIALFANGKIQAFKMPKDLLALNDWFTFVKERYSNVIVCIEKVQAYRGNEDDIPGKKFGINKMLAQYSSMLATVKIQGFRYVEIYPISWQTTLGLKMKRPEGWNDYKFKQHRKHLYKEYAQEKFPSLKVTLNTSDALCLVMFAYVKARDDIEWIRERIKNGASDQMKII